MTRSAVGSFAQRLHTKLRREREGALPRGEFLAGFAASLAVAGCAGASPELPRVPLVRNRVGQSRIVIIGAGVAGTTCAYRLYQAGLSSRIFEASARVGGRTWTLRDYFRDGQYAEHGGQLIATSQYSVRRLAAELELRLVDLNALYPRNCDDTYVIDGARYTHEEALADYQRHVYEPLGKAAKSAGSITTFYHHTRAGVELDRTNVNQWIDRNVQGGTSSKIGKLLALATLSEYGGDLNVQSALNLIYLFAGMPRSNLNLSGTGEDDKYTIDGGNDQLVARMIARLPPGTVRLETSLAALSRNSDGSYTCTLASGGSTNTIQADVVVLAIPFTVLRLVDLKRAGFSPRKRQAIQRLDLGSNAKMHLQFTSPYWFAERYSGTAYATDVYQDAWDTSIGQRGRAGMLVCFPGGAEGAAYSGAPHGTPSQAVADRYLRSLEPSLPGATTSYNSLAYQDFWIGDPFARGAYSYYKTGQYTTLCGTEAIAQGNVHFCGEQTSIEWQGYINGAVESGERAAREILQDLGMSVRSEFRAIGSANAGDGSA